MLPPTINIGLMFTGLERFSGLLIFHSINSSLIFLNLISFLNFNLCSLISSSRKYKNYFINISNDNNFYFK